MGRTELVAACDECGIHVSQYGLFTTECICTALVTDNGLYGTKVIHNGRIEDISHYLSAAQRQRWIVNGEAMEVSGHLFIRATYFISLCERLNDAKYYRRMVKLVSSIEIRMGRRFVL